MLDHTRGRLERELKFAKEINDDSLQKCIDNLKEGDERMGLETHLMEDYDPHSFYFERRRKDDDTMAYNGGIIFHGKRDGYGSGSGPTFSVTLDKAEGWRIHT